MENIDEGSVIQLKEKIIQISRVARVVKGGKRLRFRVLAVVGDERGNVGVALGKASETATAIRKAIERARKSMIRINIAGTTVPHPFIGEEGAARVLLKPAVKGTGVIAGGAVRAVLEACGIKDIITKSLGSKNQVNVSYATLNALKSMKNIDQVAKYLGKHPKEMLES